MIALYTKVRHRPSSRDRSMFLMFVPCSEWPIGFRVITSWGIKATCKGAKEKKEKKRERRRKRGKKKKRGREREKMKENTKNPIFPCSIDSNGDSDFKFPTKYEGQGWNYDNTSHRMKSYSSQFVKCSIYDIFGHLIKVKIPTRLLLNK